MFAVEQIIKKGDFFLPIDKHDFLHNYSRDYYIADSNNLDRINFAGQIATPLCFGGGRRGSPWETSRTQEVHPAQAGYAGWSL